MEALVRVAIAKYARVPPPPQLGLTKMMEDVRFETEKILVRFWSLVVGGWWFVDGRVCRYSLAAAHPMASAHGASAGHGQGRTLHIPGPFHVQFLD